MIRFRSHIARVNSIHDTLEHCIEKTGKVRSMDVYGRVKLSKMCHCFVSSPVLFALSSSRNSLKILLCDSKKKITVLVINGCINCDKSIQTDVEQTILSNSNPESMVRRPICLPLHHQVLLLSCLLNLPY